MKFDGQIYAMQTGRRTAQVHNFLYQYEGKDSGEPLEIAYYYWCIKRGDYTILIDCGFDDQEAKKRGLEDICSQGDLLNLAGIEMEQIKIIVLTHLHWDHMGGIKYFKNAKVIAPKEDVNFYNSNAIRHEFISRYLQKQDIELLNQRIKEGNVILVHDDYEIMPGIKMLWIGGHTPGTHFVAIDTAEGCYVLASDVGSLYMNIQQNIPPGIFQNLLQCIEGLNLIKHIATNDEFIIPAHDVGVMDKYTCVKTGVIQIY